MYNKKVFCTGLAIRLIKKESKPMCLSTMTDDRDLRLKAYIEAYKSSGREQHKKYAGLVLDMIKAALADRHIDVAYTSAREKDLVSLEKKCQKQVRHEDGTLVYKYSDFRNEIMDRAGVRIVTYLLDDVNEVAKVVKELFDVKEQHSEDKLELLGANKVGYLSVHYIVTLKGDKIRTGEDIYRGLTCEVQIRTVLEDAWAQIFHDRQYKTELQTVDSDNLFRRTNLLSGSLELLDYQISDVVTTYDRLSGADIAKRLREILDESINREGLLSYIDCKLGKKSRFYNYERIKTLLDRFGIKTIRELDALLRSTGCENKLRAYDNFLTADKIVSYILMIYDLDMFFQVSGSNILVSRASYDFLNEFVDIRKACEKYSITIEGGGKDVK